MRISRPHQNRLGFHQCYHHQSACWPQAGHSLNFDINDRDLGARQTHVSTRYAKTLVGFPPSQPHEGLQVSHCCHPRPSPDRKEVVKPNLGVTCELHHRCCEDSRFLDRNLRFWVHFLLQQQVLS